MKSIMLRFCTVVNTICWYIINTISHHMGTCRKARCAVVIQEVRLLVTCNARVVKKLYCSLSEQALIISN